MFVIGFVSAAPYVHALDVYAKYSKTVVGRVLERGQDEVTYWMVWYGMV